MIKTISALAIATLATSVSAQAADLIVLQPQPIATYAPAFNWTGLYIGADVGYGWGKVNVTAPAAASFDARGIVGGVHAGYNHDVGGFVLGAEADFSLSDVHFTDTAFGVTSTVRLENYGSVRARVGLPIDRFLPYVTGGVAFGTGAFNVSAPPVLDVTDRQAHFGWTIGAGAEYAVTDNVILRAEYLYTDLGTKNYHANNVPGGIDGKVNFGTVRAGVSFKF